jgi:hypothetical protein
VCINVVLLNYTRDSKGKHDLKIFLVYSVDEENEEETSGDDSEFVNDNDFDYSTYKWAIHRRLYASEEFQKSRVEIQQHLLQIALKFKPNQTPLSVPSLIEIVPLHASMYEFVLV